MAFSATGRERSTEPMMRWRLTIMLARLSSALMPPMTPISIIVPASASDFILSCQVSGADMVEDHVDTAFLGDAPDFVGEGLLAVVDDVMRTL